MKFDKGPDLRPLWREYKEDYAVLAHVLAEISKGRYYSSEYCVALEFGVATGTTLEMISRVLPVIGFDSFEGLPEDWRLDFPAGSFAGIMPPRIPDNATLAIGPFEDMWPNPVVMDEFTALLHIDCDLYSSTKTVFDGFDSAAQLRGCYIVFDEFFGYRGAKQHEQKAFQEFIERTGAEYTVVGHGREQWAVKIR